ncbi:MAG: FG-GAP-like repeat-containing protein, partial [Ilumatobacteraceae bacterium]
MAGASVIALIVVGTVSVSALRDDSSSGTGDTGAPAFVNDTATAGIDHTYAGDFEFFVGGGVAAFDCDDDMLADLFFAGGTDPAALYRNESPIGGALRFEHVASPITDLTQVTGAYPIDIDSDGLLDLAVLRRGANVMLRGLGDCRFENANESFGLDGGDEWTTAFSAMWEGANTLPTLAYGNYLVPDSD